MATVKTGVRKAFFEDDKYQAWLQIDHQTFYLQPMSEEEEISSEDHAKWYEKQLRVALERITELEN